jgi:Fe(3+) dicitrate transport protein
MPAHPSLRLLPVALSSALFFSPPAPAAEADPGNACRSLDAGSRDGSTALFCPQIEQVTIFGSASDVIDIAGGATYLDAEDLQRFQATDVVRALRQVPGVSFQLEDGFGLRPNISIRGTATERSSRVTLMEDGVLIAPAPYTAPSAYYFPTFGRVHAVEVLKGPAAITQGPYTVGGAVNLLSTPIPERTSGMLEGEYGSFGTWRAHGWYGGGNEQMGFLVETHQWRSDGYQDVDRSNAGTGLDKEDYLAKLRFSMTPPPARAIRWICASARLMNNRSKATSA